MAFTGSNTGRSGEVYDFEDPLPAAPRLPGEAVVAPDLDRLIDTIAADLVVHAENCVREFGDFHLALSGGRTPQPLYERLMYDPNYRRLPWRRTHLWLVEERCVPFDDDASVYRAINETIGDHADIPAEQVHPIYACSPNADTSYEDHLKEALGWREKGQDRLDFVLLRLAEDGHTARLYPHTEPLHEQRRFVRFSAAADASPATEGITMTLPIINAARFIAVMATGAGVAPVLRRIAAGRDPFEELPILGVQPLNGELKWYLDAGACAESS